MTKKEIVTRLIKEGRIDIDEAMELMGEQSKHALPVYPVHPYYQNGWAYTPPPPSPSLPSLPSLPSQPWWQVNRAITIMGHRPIIGSGTLTDLFGANSSTTHVVKGQVLNSTSH